MIQRPTGNKRAAKMPDRGEMIEHTYAKLREEIFANRLKPGIKLTAEHVASSLNVSRTPIRQALERLRQEGYVVHIPARGYYVAEIGSTEARDLYEVRQFLEGSSLGRAFDHGLSEADINSIAVINERYSSYLDTDSSLERAAADQEFHLALAGLSRNAVLYNMLRNIFERLNLRRRNDGYWYLTSGTARAHEGVVEHGRIVDALRSGKKADAIAALEAHLVNARINYERFLNSLGQ